MDDPDVVDTAQAAELLGVPAETIRSWSKRRRITPVGYRRGMGRGGRTPLWMLDELEPLAQAYRSRVRHAATDER